MVNDKVKEKQRREDIEKKKKEQPHKFSPDSEISKRSHERIKTWPLVLLAMDVNHTIPMIRAKYIVIDDN
ncbi:hypothetical protein CEXT_509871 [Caerostris extrusa]|uniref:Uncharacterized protein n=1 Tax=Caerostris extrusa TaxID=172846 RepID=A0AAV4NHP1_CAEEX|nr:hypothetical protein CEXT_509871 [Caerostris extrusa]